MELLLRLFEAWGIPKRRVLHEYARLCLGKDMAPVHDELGCAEAVNNIVNRALGSPIGGGASTYWMYQALRKSLRWYRVYTPEPGDVVISPTGYGNIAVMSNGHVGIVGFDGTIMSNNSWTGKWDANYTLHSWRERYAKQGNYPVYFYRVL